MAEDVALRVLEVFDHGVRLAQHPRLAHAR